MQLERQRVTTSISNIGRVTLSVTTCNVTSCTDDTNSRTSEDNNNNNKNGSLDGIPDSPGELRQCAKRTYEDDNDDDENSDSD
jgi:hypothetical protein